MKNTDGWGVWPSFSWNACYHCYGVFIHNLSAWSFFQHAVWQSAEDTVRDRGPDFEEQPRNVIFPEGSTEEQILLTCQARASPPAAYRWSSLLPAVFLFLCKSMAVILTSVQEPLWWSAYSVQLGDNTTMKFNGWLWAGCYFCLTCLGPGMHMLESKLDEWMHCFRLQGYVWGISCFECSFA